MVASGRNAPRHVNEWVRRVDGLDDRRLFDYLQALGGVPKGLSFSMAQPFLTVIRHDHAMFRDYDPGEVKIDVPILVLAGKGDTLTNGDALAQWANHSSRAVSVQWFDGGHYFFADQPELIARTVESFWNSISSSAPVDATTSGEQAG